MHSKHALPSERSFGIVFGVVFALVAGWFWWADNMRVAAGCAGVSALLFLAAAVFPKVLSPANRAWFKFGLLLSRVMTPVVMGIIYFLIVSPMGFLMRLFGRDAGGFFGYGKQRTTAWHERAEQNLSDDFTKQH